MLRNKTTLKNSSYLCIVNQTERQISGHSGQGSINGRGTGLDLFLQVLAIYPQKGDSRKTTKAHRSSILSRKLALTG